MQIERKDIENLLNQCLHKEKKISLQKISQLWLGVQDKQNTRQKLWSEFMKLRAEKQIDSQTFSYFYRLFRCTIGLNVSKKMVLPKLEQVAFIYLQQKIQKDEINEPIWIKNKSVNRNQLGPLFVETQLTLQNNYKFWSIICSLCNSEEGGYILVVKQCDKKTLTKGFEQPSMNFMKNVDKKIKQAFQELSTRDYFKGSTTKMKDLVWYQLSKVPIYEVRDSSLEQTRQYGILIKVTTSMQESNGTRALFYMNIIKGEKLIPKCYKVKKDTERTGGYREQEINTQLYNCLLKSYKMTRNKGYPIKKKVNGIRAFEQLSSKTQRVRIIIESLRQYDLSQQFPQIRQNAVILQLQVDEDKWETIMNQIKQLIKKEAPEVNYYILTPLRTYQERRADKNKAIEGENWSKYIFFIVFIGDHQLPIYKRFKTTKTSLYAVSAVDNLICIQNQGIKYCEFEQMIKLVQSKFNIKPVIINAYSKEQITEKSSLQQVTIQLQLTQKHVATCLCTILTLATKRKSCRSSKKQEQCSQKCQQK